MRKSGLPARIGLHHRNDGLHERAGCEVLACAFLAFAGGLFEQALERRALHVHVHRGPVLLVNHGDDALEVDGIVKARRGLGEDVGQQPAGLAELAEDVGVVVGQRGAGLGLEAGPRTIRDFLLALGVLGFNLGQVNAARIGHLEEQQIGELFDVVAVVHAVVAQRVAEAPEFLDDVGHVEL
jgi:hypothetical protein